MNLLFLGAKNRWMTITLVGVVLTQVVSYIWRADRTMPVAGITALRDHRLLLGDDFAVIRRKTWEILTPDQRTTLLGYLKRRVPTVYLSENEVPDSRKHFRALKPIEKETHLQVLNEGKSSSQTLARLKQELETGQRMVGYDKGMELGWRIEQKGLFWMKCDSSCWSASLGSEGGSDLFVWVLLRWIRIHSYGHEVA